MELKDLHAEYGRLLIQQEILQNMIMEVKRAIADEMNKQKEPPKEPKTDSIQN